MVSGDACATNDARDVIYDAPPTWTVLLIAGSSGTGKTTLARALGQHYGVSVLHGDDLRLAVERTTTPVHHPTLHRFLTDTAIWQHADAVRDTLIAVTHTLEPAFAVVIENHRDQPEMGPIIIEGDSILPWLTHTPVVGQVRALCLHEADEDALFDAMQLRGRGFAQYTPQEQRVQARGKWLHGEWLRDEATHYGVPVLAARPYNSALARALRVLNS